MVKLIVYLMLLIAGSIGFLGCDDKSRDLTEPLEFSPAADQFVQDAINIASIVNVDTIRDSMLLAAKQINAAGGVLGKPLNVVSVVASDTEHAVRLATDILQYDIKLMGVSYSSRSKAVAQLTIPMQIPLISESATSTFFTQYEDEDFYFRMVPSDVYQAQILATLAIQQGFQTAVTVHNESDQYGETLTALFEQNFELSGGTVLDNIQVPFSIGQGFDTFIHSIEQLNPDVILDVILEADESANFVNETLSSGLSSQFLFPDASAGISSFSNNIANPDLIADALGTAPGFGFKDNLEAQFFIDSYRQQFGIMPDTFDVNGYDLVMVAALAIEHAGISNNTQEPTGVMVRDSLRAVMNAPGQKLGPSQIGQALSLVRQGLPVDYSGAYADNDWDENGDVIGEIVYDVLSINSETKEWQTQYQQKIVVP